jgi:hypothetical protein
MRMRAKNVVCAGRCCAEVGLRSRRRRSVVVAGKEDGTALVVVVVVVVVVEGRCARRRA